MIHLTKTLYSKPVIERLKINQPPSQKLAVVQLGSCPNNASYLKIIEKTIPNTVSISLPRATNTAELIKVIKNLNNDLQIHGIMVLRPLPSHIDSSLVALSVDPSKDVDCMHPLNLYKIYSGDLSGFVPCTVQATLCTLSCYSIPIQGARIAVIGRSETVGKPLANALTSLNATVTLCHSHTQNLASITKESDIVITAIGKAKWLTRDFLYPKATVIDLGMSVVDGKICGDADYDSLLGYVDAITPVPQGVGNITTEILKIQLVWGSINNKQK